jgi:hypothetical protein
MKCFQHTISFFVEFYDSIFCLERPEQCKLCQVTYFHFEEFCGVINKRPWLWASFGRIKPVKISTILEFRNTLYWVGGYEDPTSSTACEQICKNLFADL